MVSGLSRALVARFARLDDAFHGGPGCYWCAVVDGLKHGRPVQVGADALHGHVPHDALGCSGLFCHDSRERFVVTGDRWERVDAG